MKISWDNDKAMKDFTYTNYSLGHKSCFDNIIMSGYIFDGIIRNMLFMMVTIPQITICYF